MNNNKLQPRQSLNKAFLKVKPNREQIELFKSNLINLLNQMIQTESEEFHKNLIADFLKNTYYSPHHFINTKGRNDLVIHNGKDATSSVGVILEVKKLNNKTEMLKIDNLNTKAFQELVLYFLRERITNNNLEIKYLIVTNIDEWFIFDANIFEKEFAQNQALVQQFADFEEGRLTGKTTDFFYQQIVKPAITASLNEITFTHCDLRDYETYLRDHNIENDRILIPLFKLFSPEHLLKLPFANDSNSLDKGFYSELLHIIGLTETKQSNKKIIARQPENSRHLGSLIENAISQLDSLDKISRLENPEKFGANYQQQLFNVALELAITWINRILFLKLLEAQLIKYHQGDNSFAFLNLAKVHNYDDLNQLFFSVLARQYNDRNPEINQIFGNIPYLNSSLFEPTDLEHLTILISNLRDQNLPIFSATVLKDNNGKKRTGNLNALQYLFEFLNAYDFSSEGAEDIAENNKKLINASVLGLIFEKINGYQDGSFFTPGFITMYMCRETIRRAVLQKFNQVKGWHCQNFNQLHDKITDKQEANHIINSIRICDPAVGSGHFLVSALNELIAIKSELNILMDKQGKTLKDYYIKVDHDELIVYDDDKFFEYNPKNRESQRIQETLFHEKQTIIENCLFGVDINPNSVKICRLRLWIELLKNAYYKPSPPAPYSRGEGMKNSYSDVLLPSPNGRGAGGEGELETLPNIDINIKCGNSLISRFGLDADIRPALKKHKYTIETYRKAVQTYRNAENKEQKREMERLINGIKGNLKVSLQADDKNKQKLVNLQNQLYSLENQTLLFEETKTEKKAREKKIAKLQNEIDKLEAEIADIESGKVYENALEWRFEFPEVLNDEGDFIGFDVVIGNPPYIRQEEFSAIKPFLKGRFSIYNAIADLLTYFVETGYNILNHQGVFQFIISNKFTRANYGKQMRSFLLDKTQLTHFIDFSGLPVFDEATVDAAILGFVKNKPSHNQFFYANLEKNKCHPDLFRDYLQNIEQLFFQNNLTENSWSFDNDQVLQIKQKVESQGVRLKDWDISIYRGILTGYNEAFIIDGNKRQELIAKDPKSEAIIKPLLRGRDIQKYYPDYQDLWLINLHNGYNKDKQRISALKIEDYPAIKEHLDQFLPQLQKRTDKGKTPYNLRNCAYIECFEQPKIIYPNMTKFLPFVIDLDNHYYHNDKSFHLITKRLFWLCGFLNSKLFQYCFKDNFPALGEDGRELRKVFFEQIPVKPITETQEKPFVDLITQILNLKKSNSKTDTSALEREIDQLVYQLYGLTEDEIKIIESET